ncbi:MAG: (d)CMP kinase [Myxococcota bacterium]|nr:(d)CMP kinase [Myxococcota bacterium]
MSVLSVAIDGPASSGKGTVARLVAHALGYGYVDTGSMYRAVAWDALQRDTDLGDEAALSQLATQLDYHCRWDGNELRIEVSGTDVTQELREQSVGQAASQVAVLPGVRAALLVRQRELGAQGGVVMDGRDIGTVVLPDADLKIFLDASIDERARRRHAELQVRGLVVPYQTVRREIEARDTQDMERTTAPLRLAPDAVHVDTTFLSARDAAEHIVALARARS